MMVPDSVLASSLVFSGALLPQQRWNVEVLGYQLERSHPSSLTTTNLNGVARMGDVMNPSEGVRLVNSG